MGSTWTSTELAIHDVVVSAQGEWGSSVAPLHLWSSPAAAPSLVLLCHHSTSDLPLDTSNVESLVMMVLETEPSFSAVPTRAGCHSVFPREVVRSAEVCEDIFYGVRVSFVLTTLMLFALRQSPIGKHEYIGLDLLK